MTPDSDVSRRARPGGRAGRRQQRDEPPDQSQAVAPADYQHLFTFAPDAILVVDDRGRYIDANPAAERMTGYRRDELLSKSVGDLAPPDQRSISAERFKVLRERGQARADRTVIRKDGRTVSVEAHAVALGNGTFFTILRDITERRAAESELKRSLDAYSTLVDLCGAAVISAGPDGRMTSWNPAAETLFGYSAAEALGRPVVDLIPTRFRKEHETAFARHVAAPGGRFERTIRSQALRKDGGELPVDISVAVGMQGYEQVFTAVVRDVSEHERMVEQLNDALQRLRFHVERMPLAYIAWDTDFRVVEWNPAAQRTFGYTREEAIGRHAFELIVPPEAVETVERVWSDLLKGDTSSHSINRNMRKDGSALTCEWFNTPLKDSAGNVRGAVSMARDVTEREWIEARLRDAQKFESLGVLASGVAHDFNSSLMVILGNTALLRAMQGMPAAAIDHIELIEESGARASRLIKHLLTYARTGRHNPQPTDVNAVIKDAALFVRSSIGKAYELRLDLARTLPPVLADRSQLEQIILNLCLNARQAMEQGGVIRVVTRRKILSPPEAAQCRPYDVKPGEYVELLVADNGCGMDEATVQRIFDPFFTTKSDGHGLGLAAVLGILRQHSAAARVDSKPGQGTDFHIFFPVYHPQGQE